MYMARLYSVIDPLFLFLATCFASDKLKPLLSPLLHLLHKNLASFFFCSAVAGHLCTKAEYLISLFFIFLSLFSFFFLLKILWCSQSGDHPQKKSEILLYTRYESKVAYKLFYIIGYLLELIVKIWQIWATSSMKNHWCMVQNHIFQVENWQNFVSKTIITSSHSFWFVRIMSMRIFDVRFFP